MKAILKSVLAGAAAALLCLGAAGCSKVSGHTYADNEGIVKIDFQSGGKATATIGPIATACTYTESGKTITLACQGQSTIFTVGNDGALNGPPDGMLNHLTRVK